MSGWRGIQFHAWIQIPFLQKFTKIADTTHLQYFPLLLRLNKLTGRSGARVCEYPGTHATYGPHLVAARPSITLIHCIFILPIRRSLISSPLLPLTLSLSPVSLSSHTLPPSLHSLVIELFLQTSIRPLSNRAKLVAGVLSPLTRSE